MNEITRALIELNKIGVAERKESREVERLTALAEGLGGQGFGGEPRGGGASDRLARSAVRLSEYREYVKTERRSRLQRKLDAFAAVWRGLDTKAAFVAIAIAYEGKNIKEIAELCGMSERWVYMQIERLERAEE